MTSRGSKFLSAALAAAALVTAGTAEAALVVSLRFADGSTSKDVSAATPGTTYVVDVWMSATGADANANEGFNAAYFGAQTDNLTPNVDGDVTARATATTFSASGNSLGTIQSLSHAPYGADAMDDVGGAALNNSTGWMRATAGSGTYVSTPDEDPVAAGFQTRVGTVTFTINAVDTAGLGGPTDSVTLKPILPSTLLASTRATWLQDGAQVNAGTAGTGGYSTGGGVTFSVVPEPATLGLAAVAGLGLLARRRRRV